jgi:glycosyltransferase involved in cell wall biosynthesis
MLTQSYRPNEWIVVDDRSTDRTREVVATFLTRSVSGCGVVCIEQKRRGAPAARNAGRAASHREFIQFLNGDDRLDRELEGSRGLACAH